MFKIISKKLYDEYTKEIFGFHQYAPTITKQQLYEVFKFHCANQRVYNEIVDYIYNSIQKNNKDHDLKNIYEMLNEIQYLLKITYAKKKIRRKVKDVMNLLNNLIVEEDNEKNN